jgi:hypothetical protein
MSLRNCLGKHGLDEGTIALIEKNAKNYVRDGASIQDAARSATRDRITELKMQAEKIMELAPAQDKEQVTLKQDRAYLAAVERGDTETAQKMVDEAAKKAGANEEKDDIRYALKENLPLGKVQNVEHDTRRINLDTIPQSERAFVTAYVDNTLLADKPNQTKTRHWKDVQAVVEKQLRDSPHVRSLLKQSPDSKVNDQMIAELGQLYANAALKVREAQDAAHANPTDANKARFLAAYSAYQTIDLRYFGAATEAGRALAIMKKMKVAMRANDPYAAVRGAMEDRGITVTPEELQALLALPPGDTRAFLEWQRGVMSAREGKWNKAKNWLTTYRMFNMLFNTATQSANVVSNAIKTALDVPVDVTDALFSKNKHLADVATYYAALIKGVLTSAVSAGQTLTKGISDFELTQGLFSGAAGEKAAAELFGGVLNPLNWGLRVTRAGDVLFRDAHYLAATEALATRSAKAKGLKGDALKKEIEDGKLSGRFHEEAMERANQATFQEDSERLRKALQFVNSVPGLRWVLPFVKTPWNINAAAMRYLPGVGALAGAYQKQSFGRIVGEQIVGSSLSLGLGYAMAAAGLATGAAPDDEGDKDRFFNAEKKEAYSLKIGGQWVRYSRLGQLAMPILAGVAYHEYVTRGAEEPNKMKAVGSLMGRIGKMISDQSMLMGINGLSKAVAEPDKYGETFLKNLASQLVPAASAQRQATRATEKEILEPGDWLDKLLADLPKGERTALFDLLGRTAIPQKYDTLGRPQTYRGGGWQAWIGWVKGVEDNDDPVVQELLDLNVDFPGAVGKTIREQMGDEQRTAKEKRLGRKLTEKELKVTGELSRDDLSEKRRSVGKSLYNSIKGAMESERYKAAKDDPQKRFEILTKVVNSRRKLIGNWTASYNKNKIDEED